MQKNSIEKGEKMKKKPTSKKKHKELRRIRKADWDKSRKDMERRDRVADDLAHEFIKEALK